MRWQTITRRDKSPITAALYVDLPLVVLNLLASPFLDNYLLYSLIHLLGTLCLVLFTSNKRNLIQSRYEKTIPHYKIVASGNLILYSILSSVRNQVSSLLLADQSLNAVTLIIAGRINQINGLALSGVSSALPFFNANKDYGNLRNSLLIISISLVFVLVAPAPAIFLTAYLLDIDVSNFDMPLYRAIVIQVYLSIATLMLNFKGRYGLMNIIESSYIASIYIIALA